MANMNSSNGSNANNNTSSNGGGKVILIPKKPNRRYNFLKNKWEDFDPVEEAKKERERKKEYSHKYYNGY